MWTTILLIVVLLILGGIVYVITRPNELVVERKGRIQAPPEKIFEEVNDFRRWARWSPWEHLDPTMTKDFSGPDRGKGSVYTWKGNAKAGEGRMEVIESTSPSTLRVKLDFVKPFPSSNTTVFMLVSQGEFTEMTWRMQGPAGFMTKLMCVVMDLDKAIGKDFEKGLANLRELVEKG